MQDWNYVFGNCFEVTVETNCVKFPKAQQLYNLWNEHKYSLLHFINLVHNTINGKIDQIFKFVQTLGFIVDEQTGLGIWNASISIGQKEKILYSHQAGDYYRPILPGTYEVQLCMVQNSFIKFRLSLIIKITIPKCLHLKCLNTNAH